MRSQSREPTPTPTANATRRAVVIASLPLRMPSVYAGSWIVIAEPKNQNHDMPRIDRKTLRSSLANPTMCQVSVQAFQLIFRSGSTGLVEGI